MPLIQTPSQTVGPFFNIGLIYDETQSDLVQEQTAGFHILLSGTVYDGDGQSMPDAMVEIWQPDANGIYNHPADPRHAEADPHFRGFGRAENPHDGQFTFHTIKPGSRDGQAPYINVNVFARGLLIHALTRIYFADEAANANDSVLTSVPADRRHTLLAARDDSTTPPTYRFDIHMQGVNETIFFDPQPQPG